MDEILKEVGPALLADRFVLEIGTGVVRVIDTVGEETVREYSGADRLLNATAHVQALNEAPGKASPWAADLAAASVAAHEQRRAEVVRVDEIIRSAVEQVSFCAGQLERAMRLRERLLLAAAKPVSPSLLAENASEVPQGGFGPLEPQSRSEAVVKDDAYWELLAHDVRAAKARLVASELIVRRGAYAARQAARY